jgi:hypothetical protein
MHVPFESTHLHISDISNDKSVLLEMRVFKTNIRKLNNSGGNISAPVSPACCLFGWHAFQGSL